jgi:hypothetical protein
MRDIAKDAQVIDKGFFPCQASYGVLPLILRVNA